MKILRRLLLILTGATSSILHAQQESMVPTRPTEVNHSVVPIAFADDPLVRNNAGHEEPFIEGHLAYGYSGKVMTAILSGKRVIVPAGSPAYAIPMLSSAGGGEQLVWCAIATPPKEHLQDICLVGSTFTSSANDSLLTTGLYAPKYGPEITGGDIELAPFSLGEPIRVAYYIQNLGKIMRIKGEAWVGSIKVNQWGLIFGTIMRPKSAEEKLVAIGGGVLGIKPDPSAAGHYIVRAIKPARAGENAIMQEIRNDPTN